MPSQSKPRTKFFTDTEFIERGSQHPITLISLGAVSEAGDEFYAVNSEFKEEDCSEWVKANVLPHLGNAKRIPLQEIAVKFFHWVELVSTPDTRPEFWGYYADYDWVVIAQMFGTMMNLPKGWPMYCRDIKQWCDQLGNPELPEKPSTEHNALADAKWNREAHAFLASTDFMPEQWRLAKEQTPEHGQRVWAYSKAIDEHPFVGVYSAERGKIFATVYGTGDWEFTHWMPRYIPLPPGDKN